MEYNRMVAYIYSYPDGVKGVNVGFAKIELRNNVIKFRINMKNIYSNGYSVLGVYLFFRRDDSECAIKIGEMVINGGSGDFTYEGSGIDIEQTGIGFNDICGIFMGGMEGKKHFFASEWDDISFDYDKILYEDQWNRLKAMQWEEEDVNEPENLMGEPPMMLVEPECFEEESQSANDSGTMEAWERLIGGREKLFMFADDDFIDVVEINPEDIEKMPNTNWHLLTNSFVNYGYNTFRHMIAGKINDKGVIRYFIGVPGVYNRRERATAGMYGFNCFKFSMRSDIRLSQFGYWYREVSI